jgi:hypothetical protein
MSRITVSIGANRFSKVWTNADFTWPEFVAELRRRTATMRVTRERFQSFGKREKTRTKDVGGYVTGALKDGASRREAHAIESRSLIALDADHGDDEMTSVDLDLALPGVAAALHPSASNAPGSPRQRLLIPLSRPITDPLEFEAVSRIVAGRLGADRFDSSSYEWNRLMFWPACCIGETLAVTDIPGAPLDPDALLAEWGDWSDLSKLPGKRKIKCATNPDAVKNYPPHLNGLRGAFHEVYGSIESIIDEHLADVYRDDGVLGRRTFAGGDSANGLVLYAHSKDPHSYQFATSHHTGHDPASELASANGWELVKVHLFGNGPGSERKMIDWVRALPDMADAVREEDDRRSAQAAFGGFEDEPEDKAAQAEDREQVVQRAVASIDAAANATELEQVVAPRIAACEWSAAERERLAKAMQRRFTQVVGTTLPISTAREWVTPSDSIGPILPDLNGQGRPLGTPENVEALCRWHGIIVRYNTMTKDQEILIPGASFSVDNAANASLARVYGLCKQLDMKLTFSELKAFICGIADKSQFSPPLAWIQSRPWDGVDRLKGWFDTVVGPPEKTALKEALMRRWALQCIAILHNIGSTMARGILTFQGSQYQGKTRWFKALAPEGMVGTGVHLNPNDKDCVKILIRFWIVEVGELDGITRKYDIAVIKNFVSLLVDRQRLPYAVAESAFPRRTSIGATVNDDRFLRDSTGNSRFWVVPADSINADHSIDMQQLWAQVYQLWKNGEQHWLTDDEMAMLNESNKDYQVEDPLEESLRTRLPWEDPTAERIWVPASKAAEMAGLGNLSHGERSRVGKILRDINGNRARRVRGVTQLEVPNRPERNWP